MKLLYAEDEPALSEAVVDYLTYHKYIVDAVYDGVDAYDYAMSGEYDGIILDIMMPKRDGLEVLSALRRNGCRTPVLLLTAKHRWKIVSVVWIQVQTIICPSPLIWVN